MTVKTTKEYREYWKEIAGRNNRKKINKKRYYMKSSYVLNKKEKKEAEKSYKRFQKFKQNFSKFVIKNGVPNKLEKVLVEVAVKMGYNKKLSELIADNVCSNYFGGDTHMVFFKTIDLIRSNLDE